MMSITKREREGEIDREVDREKERACAVCANCKT